MKHYLLLLIAFVLSPIMKAQNAGSVALNLYGGYTFSDEVNYDYYTGDVGDGFEYGAGIEYFIQHTSSIELKYQRLDTDMPLYFLGEQINKDYDKGALNYILLGGTHYFDLGSRAMPYLGGAMGVGIVETPRSGNNTNFAWELKAGVKIKTGSPLSINLQGYLKSVTSAVGDSYYWSYYYGPVAVTDYVSTYQFGLGAVLSYNFSK